MSHYSVLYVIIGDIFEEVKKCWKENDDDM